MDVHSHTLFFFREGRLEQYLYICFGRYEDAFEVCLLMEKDEGKNRWKIQKKKAECLYELDEPEESYKLLLTIKEQVLQSENKTAQISFLKSLAVSTNDKKEALQHLNLALKLQLQHPKPDKREESDIRLEIANTLHELDRTDDAYEIFNLVFNQIEKDDL